VTSERDQAGRGRIAQLDDVRPVLQGLAEERVRDAEENVGQRVRVAGGDVFEVGVVNGVEGPVVGTVGQGVDDGGQVLNGGRAEGGGGSHYNQGFGG